VFCTKSNFLLIFTGHGHIASSYNYETRIILPRKSLRQTPKLLRLAVPKDGSTKPDRPLGLVQYESSSGTFKETCGKCGAVVFYWPKFAEGKWFPVHEGNETEFIELSVGLVDEEDSGARAERWASWYQLVFLDKPGMEAIRSSIKK